MSNFNTDVGIKIFNARKKLKMSRVELGKKVNLHESTIKRYEDGHIKSLDIEKLKEFASALDISPAYLMGWEEENKETNQNEDAISIEEHKLLKNFNKLNKTGKDEAIKRVEELTYINKYIDANETKVDENSSYLNPVAAHDDNLTIEEKNRMDEIILKKLKELGKL